MKKSITYISILLALLAFPAASCNKSTEKKMNKRISLWRKDKIPYGASVIYDNLSYLFLKAAVNFGINVNKEAPDDYKWQVDTPGNLKTAYIILSPRVVPDTSETIKLLNMAAAGCHIFISSFYIGGDLLDSLHAKMSSNDFTKARDSLQINVYNSFTSNSLSLAYPGYASGNYFTKIDSSITTIAGTTKDGKPNFIHFTYTSGGTISIQLEPFAFTNFFLLHKNNKAYLDNAFSFLPAEITRVEWDDYFRNKKVGRNSFDKLSFLLKQPSFRFAILLIALLCCLAVLAESKRRQRIVPVLPVLHNSSLDFVKTIAHLYFQQQNHKNLAKKMIAHFLDHIRSRYNISTSVLDEAWKKNLSYKSGFDKQILNEIVESIKLAEQAGSFSEEQLFSLSKKLEQFYKNQS